MAVPFLSKVSGILAELSVNELNAELRFTDDDSEFPDEVGIELRDRYGFLEELNLKGN